MLDDNGMPDFGLLPNSLSGRGGKRTSREAEFYAFDLLYLDRHDLTSMELVSRRHLLQDLIGHASGVKFSVAKRLDNPYGSGRGGEWLKIKCIQSDSFVVVGYEPSTAAFGGIASVRLKRTGQRAGLS